MQELIEYIELNIDDNDFIKHEVLEQADNLLEKEKEQMFDLIRFIRTNDKMGKSIEDLYNEFINQ